MASAESAGFEGLRRTEHDNQITVLGPNGQEAREYPQTIDFRVTVSAKKKKLTDEDIEPYPVRASGSVNDYLLKLGFRVKIFRGIEMREVDPNEVKLIGVPGD